MSDSEYVGRDGTASEGAVGVDSATLTAMQLTTLTLAVTPGTVQKRASPCSGIALLYAVNYTVHPFQIRHRSFLVN